MDQEQFLQQLRAEGYEQVTTVTRAPNGFLDVHTHPFEARALILRGEISIRCDGQETVYRPGDIFHLGRAAPHSESYGPAGVSYLVGRK